MDFNVLMYILSGLVAIAGGLILIIAKHPIRGAMGLLIAMLALAAMYAILQAHSIAVFQIIIYAGAIMVLIIYFIMLLDIKSDDYRRPFSKFFWLGGAFILLLTIFFVLKLYFAIAGQPDVFKAMSLSANPASSPDTFGGIELFSKGLMSRYLFAFEFVSTLLFAAIVAVISIVQLDWKGRKNE
ncbi:hypothetical protein B6D60_02895 [candidate division KSB1 bacterium 4484_87]|nr:MAG: hypothetical protein B6D60_02895 [candidate division KSB1 bacterium 4484_87]